MNEKIKQLGYYFITFVFTAFTCVLLLLLSISLIPREKIASNIDKSCQYWKPYKPVYQWLPDNYKLSIDFYSDPILFNIMYYEDDEHPLESLLKNEYYDAVVDGEYKSSTMLIEAMGQAKEPNAEYSRYWHGSTLFLRPLVMLFSCTQIYIINAVLLGILALVILILFFRKGHIQLALSFLVGLVVSNAFLVPSCIEFTTMYMLCFIAVLVEFWMLYKQASQGQLLCFYIVLGVLTNFFDFLTAETLPILTCLLVYYVVRSDRKQLQTLSKELGFMVKALCCWGLAYSTMWGMKWVLATCLTDVNAFTQAGNHSALWLFGTGDDNNLVSHALRALGRNIGALFPFGFLPLEYNVIAALLVVVLLCVIFLYRKEGKEFDLGRILLLLACVPILRIIVLGAHSYLHFTMTHRALMPFVMAIYLILRTQLLTRKSRRRR